MTSINNTRPVARVFICAMALCFLVMLGTSLFQRFSNPSLTVHIISGAPASAQNQQAVPDNMEIIGQLMREVAANPADREKTINLVEALMAAGQWQVAENFAQKALALGNAGGEDTRPLYLLAIIHHNKGEHAQAAELLEKTLEKGENPSARYSLGILYLHFLKQPEKGIEQLQRGLDLPDLSPSLQGAMREELDKAQSALGISTNADIPASNGAIDEAPASSP